jgi:glycosyltransferase involved in cell wall biosynthesis
VRRVLIANHTPWYGSGSGTYSLSLAAGLERRGYEIGLLTPPGGPPLAEPGIRQFVAEDVTRRFPSFTGHPLSSRLYSDLSPHHLEGITRAWVRSMNGIAHSWEPTLVHTQHLWILTSAALELSLPVVTTCHGSEIPYLDHEPYRQRFGKDPNPAAVVSVSHYVHRLASRYIASETPHVVMLNPYDESLFGYIPGNRARSRPRIGFVGRLVDYKRVDRFLTITRDLARRVPELEAWIVGDGPARQQLEDLSVALGLAGCTSFRGFQPFGSMPGVYGSLDALVLCSPTEPLGLAALEAAACGVPVFVPDEGGLAELAERPHIISYSWRERQPAVAEMAKILVHGETARQRSRRSDYVKQRYSLDSYLGDLEGIYHQVI